MTKFPNEETEKQMSLFPAQNIAHKLPRKRGTGIRIRQHTALGDFGRTVRDEPFYGTYAVKMYVAKDCVLEEAIHASLVDRYTSSKRKRGMLYRIVTYKHADGNRYVDHILFEKLFAEDEALLVLQWGLTPQKVVRDGKLARKRLSKELKKAFDKDLNDLKNRYYEMYEKAQAALSGLE
jgi:hypothetical protein